MQLSTTTSLALVDSRNANASIQLPATSGIYGRSITVKDAYGVAQVSTISVLAQGADYFETGGQGYAINTNYGFRTFVAGTNKWYVTNTSVLTPSSVVTFDNAYISSLYISSLTTTTSPMIFNTGITSFDTISAMHLVAYSSLNVRSSLSLVDQATGDSLSLVSSNAALYFNGSALGGGGVSEAGLVSTVEGLGIKYFSTSGAETLQLSTLIFNDNPNYGDEEIPIFNYQSLYGSNLLAGFTSMRFSISSFALFTPNNKIFKADYVNGETTIEVQASTVLFIADSNIQFSSKDKINFQANSNIFFDTYNSDQPQIWMSSLNVSSINQEPVYHTQFGRITLNGATPITTTFSTPFTNADYSLTFGALNLGFSSIFATSLASNTFDLNYDINDTGIVMFNATGLR